MRFRSSRFSAAGSPSPNGDVVMRTVLSMDAAAGLTRHPGQAVEDSRSDRIHLRWRERGVQRQRDFAGGECVGLWQIHDAASLSKSRELMDRWIMDAGLNSCGFQ